MNVYVSCTTQRPSAYAVFDSIRLGFPTAKIQATIVGHPTYRFIQKLRKLDIEPIEVKAAFHPQLIQSFILSNRGGPMTILDGDMLFRETVEHWTFPTLLAGYYIPLIYNDFSRCVSVPRLHTSFLWIRDSEELLSTVKEKYAPALGKGCEYSPLDPYAPRTMFFNYRPYFWDTCAVLYQMLGGTHFNKEQEDAYTHFHSASFYDIMLERLENKKGFEYLHAEAYKNDALMREYNGCINDYYQSKHQQALGSTS